MPPKLTLLQLAIEQPARLRRHVAPLKEEIELAVAWAKREVTGRQVQHAIKSKSSAHTYAWLARVIRDSGLIK